MINCNFVIFKFEYVTTLVTIRYNRTCYLSIRLLIGWMSVFIENKIVFNNNVQYIQVQNA